MNNDWLELEGKTVIVTGAASGIGKAVAQEFLNIGANVVISEMACTRDGCKRRPVIICKNRCNKSF